MSGPYIPSSKRYMANVQIIGIELFPTKHALGAFWAPWADWLE